jgi:hypothetical protein
MTGWRKLPALRSSLHFSPGGYRELCESRASAPISLLNTTIFTASRREGDALESALRDSGRGW